MNLRIPPKLHGPGVIAGTVRTSTAPEAFSFALDAKQEPAHAVAEFRKSRRDPRPQLTLVRIVRDDKIDEP
jgi:hypothetical protein